MKQQESGQQSNKNADFNEQQKPRKSFFDLSKGAFSNIQKPSFSQIATKASNFLQNAQQIKSKPNESSLSINKNSIQNNNNDGNFDLQPNDSDLIDLEYSQNTFETEYQNEQVIVKQESSQSQNNITTTIKSSYTSANGDGLLFNPQTLSIFDEVQQIIEGKDQVKIDMPIQISQTQIQQQDPEFLLEDVPKNLNQLSILLECIRQMEQLKSQITPVENRENELLQSIRLLNSIQKISGKSIRIESCSYTLDSLISILKQKLQVEDTLNEKLEDQKKSIYHLKLQITDQKTKNQKKEQDIEILQAQLQKQEEENKLLGQRIFYLQKLIEETRLMNGEDSFSSSQEFQLAKLRYEKIKIKLNLYKQENLKFRAFEEQNNILQQKLNEILEEKIKQRQQEKQNEQKLRYSLIGHFSSHDITNSKFFYNKYENYDKINAQPAMLTLSFLENKQIFKILMISKKVRSSLLSNTQCFSFFQNIFKQKCQEMNEQIELKQKEILKQERKLKLQNEQNNLRLALMEETPEDHLKKIIEKYIIKPKINSNYQKKKSIFFTSVQQKEGQDSVCIEIFETMQMVEHFILNFVDIHTSHQIQIQQNELKIQMQNYQLQTAIRDENKGSGWSGFGGKLIQGASSSFKGKFPFKVPSLPVILNQQLPNDQKNQTATQKLQSFFNNQISKSQIKNQPIEQTEKQLNPCMIQQNQVMIQEKDTKGKTEQTNINIEEQKQDIKNEKNLDNQKNLDNENFLGEKYKTANLETVSEQGTLEDAESFINRSPLNTSLDIQNINLLFNNNIDHRNQYNAFNEDFGEDCVIRSRSNTILNQEIFNIGNQSIDQISLQNESVISEPDIIDQNFSHSKDETLNNQNQNFKATQVKPLIESFDEIQTTDQMNKLLLQIGSFLVNDKQKLSKWLQGIQHAFSEFYIASKNLSKTTRDMEILKEFLALKIDKLQLRVQELLNEKEDLIAIKESDSQVKHSLLEKIQQIEDQYIVKNAELLFKSQRVQELEQFESLEKQKREKEQAELFAFKKQVNKQVNSLKKEEQLLREQNKKYLRILKAMGIYIDRLNQNSQFNQVKVSSCSSSILENSQTKSQENTDSQSFISIEQGIKNMNKVKFSQSIVETSTGNLDSINFSHQNISNNQESINQE